MGDRELFQGTRGLRSAEIMVVGEAYGSTEDRYNKPFIGESGKELDKMLSEAAIPQNKCLFTNMVNARPYNNEVHRFFHSTAEAKDMRLIPDKGLFPKPIVQAGVEKLYALIELVKPKAVIALGNYALWALTDDCFGIGNKGGYKIPTGIKNWRGSQLFVSGTDIPLMPTYHPASILRAWSQRYPAVHDLKRRFPKALKGEWNEPEYNFILRPTCDQVMETFDRLEQLDNSALLALDLETIFHHVSCIGIGWSNLDAICIPLWSRQTKSNYYSAAEESEIIVRFRRLCEAFRDRLMGQNFLYDAQYFGLYYGFRPKLKIDTLIAHHLCWPGTPRDLAYLSSMYNSYHRFWKEEGKEWHPSFSDDQHWSYNCKDCVATFEAGTEILKVVKHFGLEEQHKFQMEQFDLALTMMLRGARIDLSNRARLSRELAQTKQQIADWLEWMIPPSVYPRKPKKAPWYSSPQQLAEILFDIMKLKSPGRSTDEEHLKALMPKYPLFRKILERILEYRSVGKFKSTFIDARLDSDLRMRCSFDPAGTKTFRWSSSTNAFGNGANLQTIPKGSED